MKKELVTSIKNTESSRRRLVVASVLLKGVKITYVDETWVAEQAEGGDGSNG